MWPWPVSACRARTQSGCWGWCPAAPRRTAVSTRCLVSCENSSASCQCQPFAEYLCYCQQWHWPPLLWRPTTQAGEMSDEIVCSFEKIRWFTSYLYCDYSWTGLPSWLPELCSLQNLGSKNILCDLQYKSWIDYESSIDLLSLQSSILNGKKVIVKIRTF